MSHAGQQGFGMHIRQYVVCCMVWLLVVSPCQDGVKPSTVTTHAGVQQLCLWKALLAQSCQLYITQLLYKLYWKPQACLSLRVAIHAYATLHHTSPLPKAKCIRTNILVWAELLYRASSGHSFSCLIGSEW